VQRCRRLFDLDADPQAIAEQLGDDRDLGRLVAKAPGLRLPGTVDGFRSRLEPCSGSR
jgi:AraC family transcriptional regulator of adaptative response / DNA-3-methyladenine glycosylase II